MDVVIDRFENNFAVVELPDKTMVNIPKVLVPESKEGDIVSITINKEETEKQKNEINDLINDVFK